VKMRSVGSAAAVALMACVPLVEAADKWESSVYHADDSYQTANQLLHGIIQTHDMQQHNNAGILSTDLDFGRVAAKARHSYEVRVFGTNSCFKVGGAGGCATLDRVAEDGTTVLTPGFVPDGLLPGDGAGSMAVRWTANADESDLIKMTGYVPSLIANATNQYEIQMLDTTYLVPRWNNSGTQVTIFLIQNASTSPITGSILFYNSAGTLLDTHPLSLAANATHVLSTGSVVVLAGASGSAAIVHDGGYGALAGKAVALEPSTGFAFDTPITPIPH
jgi:hypothetical protein